MRSRFLGELSCFVQGYTASANQGKTTLLLNDAVDLAKQGCKVVYISLEIGADTVLKFLVSIAGDDSNVIMSRISVHEVALGENALHEIERIITNVNADVAIIDYLGLVAHKSNSNLSAYENMIIVASMIRSVAMATDTRIITAVQMSRNAYIGGKITDSESRAMDYLNMRTVFNNMGKLTINGKTKWMISAGRKIIKSNPVARFFDNLWSRLFAHK